VSVAADRYVSIEREINILGKGKKQIVSIDLLPDWGKLIIKTEPPGALVSLNGETIGKTPTSFEPTSGRYRYIVFKDGWKKITGNVEIEAGKTKKVPLIKLERVDGKLMLTSKPSGATIAVNGVYTGSTPKSLALVSGKTYRIKLTKVGYLPAEVSTEIESSRSRPLHVALKPEYGVVFLRTKPAGATLKVDGKTFGLASRRLRLTTELHKLEITKPGYLTHTVNIIPTPGISKRLSVTLKRKIDVQGQRAREKINTTSGHSVRMILIEKPIVFTAGASRREAGRRSNETQYKVQLSRNFVIGDREVTNAEYRRFQSKHTSGSGLSGANQPVVNVSWHDAARYLNWLSSKEGLVPAYRKNGSRMEAIYPVTDGYRLPTEAEWTYAARFNRGLSSEARPPKFPWGNSLPPKVNSGNFADSGSAGELPFAIRNFSDGYAKSAPVGSFKANEGGIHDLSGNVSEWCHDYYDSFAGSIENTLRDPSGPKSGDFHVVRGSSWRHGTITELRFSFRDYARKPRDDLGFRIARYVKNSK
jgi:formylglycine-generating enzyme required for sulfatase activity